MTEQDQHIRIIGAFGVVFLCALVIIGILLYAGKELPFYEMRYQHTDSTGYERPARLYYRTAASVPRQVGNPLTRPVNLGPSLPPPPPRAQPGHAPVPPQALALTNPLANDPNAERAGRALYEINCSMCHGRTGAGNGPVGNSYTPSPPPLRAHVQMHPPGATYYVISYGIRSTPITAAAKYLPYEWHAFRDITTERERWEIVTFLRATLGE